jgi:hypothetical protein
MDGAGELFFPQDPVQQPENEKARQSDAGCINPLGILDYRFVGVLHGI